MELINMETGQFTKIATDEFGWPEYQGAANRLVSRIHPGYYADSLAYYNLENRPSTTELELKIVRNVGGMTESTGELIHLRIIK